jgi:hypothetical protein
MKRLEVEIKKIFSDHSNTGHFFYTTPDTKIEGKWISAAEHSRNTKAATYTCN